MRALGSRAPCHATTSYPMSHWVICAFSGLADHAVTSIAKELPPREGCEAHPPDASEGGEVWLRVDR